MSPFFYQLSHWTCELSQAPESSPASEALQLIFADSGLDGKSIMLDLSKLLNEDPNLANQVQKWS